MIDLERNLTLFSTNEVDVLDEALYSSRAPNTDPKP